MVGIFTSNKQTKIQQLIHVNSWVSMLFVLVAGNFFGQVLQTYNSGSGSWTCPAGTYQVVVRVWGAGGGGGSSNSTATNGGTGGGGGSYSESVLSVTPGSTYYYSVGSGGSVTSDATLAGNGGDSWFNTSNAIPTSLAGVLAIGGGKGVNNSTSAPANGGNSASGYGTIKYSGGAGFKGSTTRGGGGGASGGYLSAGSAATSTSGATAVLGGGAGGNSTTTAPSATGSSPGAGGGGSDDVSGFTSGAGAAGRVEISKDINIQSSSTITVENDLTFYDSGLGNNYQSSETKQITFYPSNCSYVQLTFSSFATEDNVDGLMIYNGNNTSAPLISSGLAVGTNATTCPAGSYRGTGSPGTISSTASDGSLTLVFKSDAANNSSGWVASVQNIAATLNYGTISTSGLTSICSGSTPTGISISGASGASSFTYQWYSQNVLVTPTSGSVSGWTIMAGQTGTSLTASSITANTTYACWVTPGGSPSCGPSNWSGVSNNEKVQITILSNFDAGSISASGQTICSGGDPTTINNSIAANGGDNSITYKWQSNGVDIASSNSASYDPPSGLTATTTYTRWAKDGSCSGFIQSSGSWIVTINNPSTITTLSANDYVFIGTSSTAWDQVSNWLQWNGSTYSVPASYPNSNTANVILPAVSSCVINTVSIPAATIATNNITVESGQTLFLSTATSRINIAGTFTMNGTWTTPTNGSIVSFNGAGSQTIPALTYDKLQTATGGTKTLSGTTTANNVATIGASSTLDLSSFTLNLTFVGTPLVATGTFTSSTGTVNFNASGNQTVAALTYYNVQISSTNTKSIAPGTTNINGVLTINSGSTFSQSSGRTLILNYVGTPIVNSGTFSASTSATVFNASGAQTIPTLTYYDLRTAGSGIKTIVGSTTVVNNILTIGASTTFNLSSFTLRMTKTGSGLIVNSGTWNPGTGTVDFRVAGDQNIPSLSYYNLTTSTSGNKSLEGNVTVNNVLTIGASTTFQLSSYVLNLARLSGTPITNNGTFNSGTGTVVMSSNGTQVIPALTYYNLTSNSTGTKTLNGTTIVNNNLTLTSGTVAVSSQSLTLNGPYIQGTVNNLSTTASSSLVFNCTGSGPFTLPASTLIGNLTINSSGQTYNMNSNFTLSGSLTLTDGTLNIGTRTLTYSGSNITRTNGTIDASNTTGLLSFTNTSALTLPASMFASSIGKLTINGAGGVTLGSNTTVSNTLTLTSGVLTTSSNTLIINGSTLNRTSGTIDASNASATMEFGNSSLITFPAVLFTGNLNNLTLNGAGGVTLGANTTVNGNLTLTAGTLTIGANTLTYGGSSITRTSGAINASNVSANITFTNGSSVTIPSSLFSGNVSNIKLNGIGGVTLGGTVTVTNSIDLANGDLTIATSTLNFNGTTLTRTSGSIDASNSSALLNFGNSSLLTLPASIFSSAVNDLTLSGTGGLTVSSNFTISGDLNLSNGSLTLGSNTLTINTDATISKTSGLIIPGTGKIVFKAASLDGSVFSSSQANDLEINRPSGTVTMLGNIEILGDFTMTSGTVDVSSNTLKLSGDLIHSSGAIDADAGTIDLNNLSEWTLPSGFFSGDVSGLIVRGAGGLVLPDDSRITSTLTMLSGNLTMASGKKIEIGTNASSVGSVSWTAGSVVGKMKRWFSTSANYANNTSIDKASGIFPVGSSVHNRFAQINFTESTLGGYIEIQYLSGAPVVLDGFGAPISDPYNLPFSYNNGRNQYIQNADATGYWEIKPFSSAGVAYASLDDKTYNLTLRINHSNAFVSNPVTANPPGMRIIRAKGNPDGSHDDFVLANTTANITTLVSQVDFTVQSDGLTGFSWFNIGGDNETPLPIELLSFSGSCESSQIELIWKTASESNSDYFEVLKSEDGENWRIVDTKTAAGFSTSLLTYSFIDHDNTSVAYYKLNQVDMNGDSKLYDPIYVDCKGESNKLITYPNPSTRGFYISLEDSKLVGEGKIIVKDAMGSIVMEKSASINDGVNLFPVLANELKSGVYFITIENNNSSTNTIKHVMN